MGELLVKGIEILPPKEVAIGRKQVIAIMGGEASGKSTQAEFLARSLGLPVFGMGPEFRYLADNDHTELGNRCREMLAKHEYSTEELYWTVFDRLFTKEKLQERDLRNGFIIEGAFRHGWEVKKLEKRIEEKIGGVDITVIFLRAPLYQSAQRFIKRELEKEVGSDQINKAIIDNNKGELERLNGLVMEYVITFVDRHGHFSNDPKDPLGPRAAELQRRYRFIQINTFGKSEEDLSNESLVRYNEVAVN